MVTLYNVYCDESCHLENDNQIAMVLGAVWCPKEQVSEIHERTKQIKQRNGFQNSFEIKWTKVSPSQIQLYLDVIDYFFDNENLHFRGLIVPDKSKLNHELFGQTHDEWYYKMYFDLLKAIFNPKDKYHIYLDIKDTRGGNRIHFLHKVISNNMYDFSQSIVEKVQLIRSEESHILQLTDLLIGAVSYVNRGLYSSPAKLEIIKRIKIRTGYSLTKSTLLRENKFNLFRWSAQGE
ncbi:MAG: DUF3800 domain-containing protein [Firmicutes bacterium HGW-Firmicutes-12]|jgi:hypothetical protein|nr:MAG: DUF3800 domain-containing protein [Firmicutes bacterium HGW-Firmicutes-12]